MGITAVQTGSGWDVDGLTEVSMMYDRETGLPGGGSGEVISKVNPYRTRQMCKLWAGSTVLGGRAISATVTDHVQTVIESDADSFRLVLFNAMGGSKGTANIKAQIAVSTDLGAAGTSSEVTPTGSWNSVTWAGGSASPTVPAVSSRFVPGLVVSDEIFLPTVARADGEANLRTVHVMIEFPYTVSTQAFAPAWTYTNSDSKLSAWLDPALCDGRVHRPRRQACAGITTPGSFTLGGSSVDWQTIPFAIIYKSRRAGLCIAFPGDSLAEGAGAGTGGVRFKGRAHAAKLALTAALGCPVETINLGLSGKSCNYVASPSDVNSHEWAAAFLALTNVTPTHVVVPLSSPNNFPATITGTLVDATWRGTISLTDAIEAKKSKQIWMTWPPTDTATRNWGATDALRLAFNSQVRTAGWPVLDIDARMAGDTSGGQVQIKAEYDGDTIHQTYSLDQVVALDLVPLV